MAKIAKSNLRISWKTRRLRKRGRCTQKILRTKTRKTRLMKSQTSKKSNIQTADITDTLWLEKQTSKHAKGRCAQKCIQTKIPRTRPLENKSSKKTKKNPTSRHRKICCGKALLAFIMIFSIRTCAAHGMHLQAEGKRKQTPTDEKGPNLRKNQARTDNVRVMPLWHGWVWY